MVFMLDLGDVVFFLFQLLYFNSRIFDYFHFSFSY